MRTVIVLGELPERTNRLEVVCRRCDWRSVYRPANPGAWAGVTAGACDHEGCRDIEMVLLLSRLPLRR